MNRILSSEKNKTRDLFWTMFTRTALVATFFLCLGYKTFAQSFGSPTTNPFNLSSSINLSSICFADIDGDGDADMFALKKNTAIIKFWENTGTSSAPNYGSMLPLATSFGSSMGSINIADENGDGLLDLIGVESGSGNVNIIYNMGDAAIPDFNGPSQMIMLGGGGIFDLCFGDLDNDHDLDIVASSISMHQVAYFENMGGGNYNPNMSVNLNFNDFQSRPELSDIDNDGDLDILASSSTGNFVLVKNIGNSASANFDNPTTNPYGLSALATPSFSLYITDLNNNAHAEIFAVDGTNTISYYGTSCGAATPTDNNTNTAKTVCAGGNT
ncbi:MAG: VCBS repeat-containing protein, partial [Bacteroidia bacterium]|nr:VCBS repeat-containing protein [Bacteroidia bacterium]